jgi:non-specific serine/threonine protein kinase/serine/threonine-protein kinase
MDTRPEPGGAETAMPSMTAEAGDGDGAAAPIELRLGPYEVLRALGSGGMGSVYLARRVDGQFEQEVAIKVVKRGADSELILERFRAERQILAGLQHPNICRLLDGGSSADGRPYFVMERIEGEPIDAYCQWHNLTLRRRLELFLAVGDAVKYAHQRLVVHCDLKPRNILVTDDGVPKLVDFGIAKLLERPAEGGTHSGFMTPEYASPEQIRGDRITTATDVHALGIVLYQLLAGTHPFAAAGKSPVELSRAILETEPRPPSQAVGSRRLGRPLRGDLDTIVLRALSKDPARRYASAGDLAADVERHLAGRPVRARRDSMRYRAGKFVRRHRLGVAATAAAFISLVAGIGATAWQARVARSERARAERDFAEVRRTANAMVFDLHDAILDLAGSTAARRLLVAHALRLFELAPDAHGDPALQRELAEAYRKLGDVQGRPGMPNLGDLAGARASYDKGLALVEEIVARAPGDLAARHQRNHLLRVLGRQRWWTGDLDGALARAQRAFADEVAVLAARPDDIEASRLAANLEVDLGDYLGDLGRGDESLHSYRRALVRYTAVAEASDEPRFQRGISFAMEKIGDALLARGEPHGALAQYLAGLILDEANAARMPGDAQAQRRLAETQRMVANALTRCGDPRGAQPLLLRSLETSRRFLAADPLDVLARGAVAATLAHLGRAHRAVALATADPGAARAEYAQAEVHLREALATYGDVAARQELHAYDGEIREIEAEIVACADAASRLGR